MSEIKNDHNTIEMPIYYIINDEANTESDSNEKVYDFEEMANVLEDRICKYLNRNVLITISEVDEEEL